MPTRPDPNSPYMASRVEADMGAGLRTPGFPTMAGKPGVQAGDVSFPAPPAVAQAPVGRPPTGAPPSPTAAPGVRGGPVGKPVAMQPGAEPAAQGGPAGVAPATAEPGMPAQPAMAPADQYREAILRKRADLGPLPKLFRHPSLGELPVELGRTDYNPFSGRWVKG